MNSLPCCVPLPLSGTVLASPFSSNSIGKPYVEQIVSKKESKDKKKFGRSLGTKAPWDV
jgi:hypothetical protein